jgi:SAM-dependent methyltransferase
MALNPVTQYQDDRNLWARQRLWAHRRPPFDLVGWVLDLGGIGPGLRVLDVGCGNGAYLRAMQARGAEALGCDLSLGMLHSALPHPTLVNADVTKLPLSTASFDVVLAPHMLYHVTDRGAAAHGLRRVLRPGGTCIVVANGAGHLRSLLDLVEAAARQATPGWEAMRSSYTGVFSLDNGASQLAVAFDSVSCVRPVGVAPVTIDDATIVADYVASVADHYQDEVARPWSEVVAEVRRAVHEVIDAEGAFVVAGDTGAFVCR